MEPHSSPDRSQVLFIGGGAEKLRYAAAMLREAGIEAVVLSRGEELPRLSVRAVVIADAFEAGMTWMQWWDQEVHTWKLFEAALPLFAPSTRGVLVGYSRTDDRSERLELRRAMASLIRRFHSTAAMDRGVDFAMNAIEVPRTFTASLLSHRLAEHLMHRGATLADGTVVALEEIRNVSLSSAASTSFI